MENKKCTECGTENSRDFIYCKNCGSILREPPKPSGSSEQPQAGQIPAQEAPAAQEASAEQDVTAAREVTPVQNAGTAGPGADSAGVFQAEPQSIPQPQAGDNMDQSYSGGQNGYGQPQGGYGQAGQPGCYMPPQGYGYSPFAGGCGVPAVDGIPVEDVAAYVGMKAPAIIPKFVRMELSRSKVSWCGPAFTLGLFFGPLGAAIWFFYRKMYKAALLLVAAGAAAAAVMLAIAFGTGGFELTDTKDIYESGGAGYEYSYELGEFAEAFNFLTSVTTAVLAGIFGMYFYKKDTARKIRQFVSSGYDRRYYKLGLASMGGTSGGMAVLGVFIMFAVYFFLGFAAAFSYIIIS